MVQEKSKKILQLRSALGVFGAETMILELSKALADLGCENTIGVLNNIKVPHIELAQAAQKNRLSASVFPCRGQFDWQAVKKIREFIVRENISVVHTHGYKANFYGLMASRSPGVVRVATCHPWTETSYSLKARLYTALDKFWLKRFDRIVAVSDTVEQEILQTRIDRSRVSLIDNGIDTTRFNGTYGKAEVRRKLNLPVNKILAGAIGRLVPEKGYEVLFRAAKRVVAQNPDVLFVVVGDGPLKQELQRLTEELGLAGHLLLLGHRDDIPELLAAFDVFILSSRSEGLPMVILEAMAAKKAIMATQVGSIPKVLENGKCGVLVRPEVDDLEKNLLELCRNRKRIGQLGELARERIMQNYSSSAMARKYLEVYEKALREKKRV